ncbi:hypothetical protein SEPCBS119000_004732 [Sporothrix epigloea]|uniref:Uncharacterized protein n=1 Tax=Sporothrix epigloea TaxID=1892477 RepID=A0ABP0DTS7_9PEZI
MADAEDGNYEDELFADLYNDDEPQVPTAPAVSATQLPSAVKAPTATAPVSEPASYDDHSGNYDDTIPYDDDDDEVAFNLGNGSSSNNNKASVESTIGSSSNTAGNLQQIHQTPQPSSGSDFALSAQTGLHNARVGSNSKEDG